MIPHSVHLSISKHVTTMVH